MIQPTDWLVGVLTITAIYVLRKQSWIHKYDYQWPGTKMRLQFSSFETSVSIFEDPRHSRAVKWKPYQLESPIKRFFDQIWKKSWLKFFEFKSSIEGKCDFPETMVQRYLEKTRKKLEVHFWDNVEQETMIWMDWMIGVLRKWNGLSNHGK